MDCLIFGASGYLGSRIFDHLISKKINLTIDQWIEKYYQKLPTIFINKNNIYSILISYIHNYCLHIFE